MNNMPFFHLPLTADGYLRTFHIQKAYDDQLCNFPTHSYNVGLTASKCGILCRNTIACRRFMWRPSDGSMGSLLSTCGDCVILAPATGSPPSVVNGEPAWQYFDMTW